MTITLNSAREKYAQKLKQKMRKSIIHAIEKQKIFDSINQDPHFKIQLTIIMDRVDEYLEHYDAGTEFILAANNTEIVIYPLRVCANVSLFERQFADVDTFYLFSVSLAEHQNVIKLSKADVVDQLSMLPMLSSQMTLSQLENAVSKVINLGAWSTGHFDQTLIAHLDVDSQHWQHWITQLSTASIVNNEIIRYLKMAIEVRSYIVSNNATRQGVECGIG